jgi:hypothetical protein
MKSEEVTKLADLPAKWEAEAAEIESRQESGEVSGEVWDARREILVENAVDLRDALTRAMKKSTDNIPTSAMRLSDWLWRRGYPRPEPESNDICDWAIAKLNEMERELQKFQTVEVIGDGDVDKIA